MMYYIGQAFGIVATILCICTPLINNKRLILLILSIANLFTAVNLIMINEIGSAVLLNSLAVFHTLIQLYHLVKNSEPPKAEVILFFLLYIGLGVFGMLKALDFSPAFNIKTLIEFTPILSAIMFMLGVIAKTEQNTCKFLLCNCTLYIIYYGAVGSSAVFAVVFSAVTNVIALIKHRKQKEI